MQLGPWAYVRSTVLGATQPLAVAGPASRPAVLMGGAGGIFTVLAVELAHHHVAAPGARLM